MTIAAPTLSHIFSSGTLPPWRSIVIGHPVVLRNVNAGMPIERIVEKLAQAAWAQGRRP